jgi:outer membrane protein
MNNTRRGFRALAAGLLLSLLVPACGAAQSTEPALSLKDTIELALKANLQIKRAGEEINAAQANRNLNRTNFLPTLGSAYSWVNRNDERLASSRALGSGPGDQYTFTTSFTQPIFAGFGILNQYKISELGLDQAETSAKIVRQDVILDAKNAYFSVLKTQKLLEVSQQTVTSISSQKEVSENFYKVGLSPLNDLLQSQVQLANARQQLTSAQNNLEIAKTQFNTVLRRSVNAPVFLLEELDYTSYTQTLDSCLETAQKNRLEIQVADVDIEIAQKQVALSEKDYFPTVNLIGGYSRTGDDWQAHGGDDIFDSAGWNVQATATWNFWEWGRTGYGRKEKLARLAQSKYKKSEVLDNINLQVKQAWLRTKEAETNILTVEKAVEQAKENLRITEEQYKEQVATQTDVLIAQTLLTQTETNYYNSLFDFKIAQAVLFRAIGQETLE